MGGLLVGLLIGFGFGWFARKYYRQSVVGKMANKNN